MIDQGRGSAVRSVRGDDMPSFPEYETYDGLGLAELVRRGEVHPRELLDACLERIESRNPRLNAVVRLMSERERSGAEGELPAGPFHGVPLLLKDLMAAVAGEPLTSACRFLATFVPDHDSEQVRRLRRAGFVFVARTNTPEMGLLGVTEPALYGPTRNPWDPAHTPGGSSGGAAAAVASGMAPIGHGGDGGGSLRIPASCCGMFGLKPTRGRNPLGPDVGESWSGLVQEHAVTRSVRDSAALLDATRGPDLGAPYAAPDPVRPFLAEVEADPGRLRIAYTSRSLFGGTTHADCRAAVEDAATLCRSLGHEVDEGAPEFDRDELRRCYLAIVAVGTARAIEMAAKAVRRRPTPREFEAETWFVGQIGRAMGAVEHQRAIDTMQAVSRGIASFFTRFDLLLTPTLAHPPARIGALRPKPADLAAMRVLRRVPVKRLLDLALEKMAGEAFEATANTMLFNMTGQPAMSVPLAWNGAGLPIGSQFVASYGDEATLFRLAAQLEAARPWFDRRPPEA
jgi:amidase